MSIRLLAREPHQTEEKKERHPAESMRGAVIYPIDSYHLEERGNFRRRVRFLNDHQR
jgi:hypothetical protein